VQEAVEPLVARENSRRRILLLSAVGAIVLVALWWQAFFVPFWQDDYAFLLYARDAQAQGKPWYSVLLGGSSEYFWRPLSVDLYWRALYGVWGGDLRAAHAAGIVLLLLASAAVGWLVTAILRIRAAGHATLGGFWAALLYGLHGSHFLPVVWASGAQDSLLVLFSALALRFWLMAYDAPIRNGLLHAMAGVGCFTLALMSKETAMVVPLLQATLVAWLWPVRRPSQRTLAIVLLFFGITGLWWLIHQRLTLPPPPPYQLKLGSNVLRNAASLVLFSLNVPREALRFVLARRSIGAGVWGAACLALQVAGCGLWLRAGKNHIRRADLLALAAFAAVGLGPYLFLTWNCYEYYTSLALVAYAVLMGVAVRNTKVIWPALLLLVAASAISTLGNFWLDYPAVVARAKWGQRQIDFLRARQAADGPAFPVPLRVIVEDDRRFQTFGVDGLAYTLGLRRKDVVTLSSRRGAEPGQVLVVPPEGDVYFTTLRPSRPQRD
jgi:hypothetical protein